MRIGILCHASFGGSARVATELGKELARRGHQIQLFSHTTPFGAWEDIPGIQLHPLWSEPIAGRHPAELYTRWQPEEVQAQVQCMLAVAQHEGLDILHFHYAVPFAEMALAVRQRLGPAAPIIIGTLHGTDVITHGRLPDLAPRLRQALNAADAITTVSNSFATLAQEILHLDRMPKVIPNFIDLTRFQPGVRTNNRPILLHVSNFRAIKNPRSIVTIFQQIREQIDAELWLVGDGPELPGVKKLLQQTRLEADVCYWGLQRDVIPIMSQANLLLVTSEYESFCMVALEAMACGVPVLAPDVGGLPELIRHGESGFLAPPDQLDILSAHAITLLTEPVRYQAMTNAVIRQAQRFASAQIIPIYEACYHNLLHKRAARSRPRAPARSLPRTMRRHAGNVTYGSG